jgi:hypothetical protein
MKDKLREKAYSLKLELNKQLEQLRKKRDKIEEDISTTEFLLSMVSEKEEVLARANSI